MLKENITINNVDVDKFYIAMKPEIDGLNAKRFRYDVVKDDDKIIFKISADDDVAMKAAKSSIEKLYTVYKKMQVL